MPEHTTLVYTTSFLLFMRFYACSIHIFERTSFKNSPSITSRMCMCLHVRVCVCTCVHICVCAHQAVVNISSTPCISTTGRCKINVAHPLTLLASLTVSPSSPSLWVTNWTTLEGDVDISRRDLLLTDAGLPTLVSNMIYRVVHSTICFYTHSESALI